MNSEDYCKTLKEAFNQDITIKIADKPPAYISNLKISESSDSLILVYKEGNPNEKVERVVNEAAITLPSENGIQDSLADLSVTGQPLECPFDNEEVTLNITISEEPVSQPEDHGHVPLSLMDARRCLAVVNLKMPPPPLPVWVLTEATDKRKTFLLGCEARSGWRIRYWAMSHSNQTEKIPIKDMIENFESLFNVKSGYKKSCDVCCVYNIKDQPGMAKNAKCFLEARWQRPSYDVPVSQADTALIVECNVGQEESQISRWWRQLTLLQEYMEIIKQWRQTRQVQHTYQRNSIRLPSFKSKEGNAVPLTSLVQELLQKSDSMSVCRQMASPHNTTSALNSTIHELLTDKQKGQDFTDRLWSVLIEAESYEELVECFKIVFREVRKQSVKPFIFVKNKTRLASLLQGIKGSSSNLELMVEPLELMVELGMEKLKRDYMFMFLASQIANIETLNLPKLPSFSEMIDSEWQATVDGWLQWLSQIHTVLELVSVIHTTMSTPILVQVTRLALSKFVCANSPVLSLQHLINNRVYSLRAPVVAKEVATFIEGDKTFHKWMLQLVATADCHQVSSTYVLLEQSPLPMKILLELMDHESLNNTDTLLDTVLERSTELKEKYNYLQLCSVADKFPY
uniref:Protein zwilch n=1 Tax=Cuerna arida TaxID=1464854 RepID=A0A1B6H0B7_9HEMI